MRRSLALFTLLLVTLWCLTTPTTAQSCCPAPATYAAGADLCIDWTDGFEFAWARGTPQSLSRALYAAGTGSSSGTTAPYIEPCGNLDATYGTDYVIEVEMGDWYDYFRGRSTATVAQREPCGILSENIDLHDWSPDPATQAFVTPDPNTNPDIVLGSAGDHTGYVLANYGITDPRDWLTFIGYTNDFGCCYYNAAADDFAWGKEFNATIYPTSTPLTGTACDPALSSSAASLAFGEVSMGGTAKDVVLSAGSNSDVEITSTLSIIGPDASEFSVVAGSAAGTIPAGSSRNVRVRISPSSQGSKSATLRIVSDDPDDSPLDIPITANVGAHCCPAGWTYYSAVGTCVEDSGFLFAWARGTTEALTKAMYASGTGSSSGTTTPYIEPCANLDTTYGTDYVIEVEMGDWYDYFTGLEGLTTAQREPCGILAENVDAHAWTPDMEAHPFSAPDPNGSPNVVLGSAGGHGTFVGTTYGISDVRGWLTFIGYAGGSHFGCCHYNAAADDFGWGKEFNATIYATQAPSTCVPDVSASPASVDFGDVLFSSSPSQVVSIEANGAADVQVTTTVTIIGDDAAEFAITAGDTSAGTIAGGTSRAFTVQVQPATAGAKTATLRVVNDDPDSSPLDVPLAANVLLTSNPLECGDGLVGGGFYYSPTTSSAGCDEDVNANNCFFAVDNLATSSPAVLRRDTGAPGDDGDAPYSELKADDGTDYIYLAFDLPSKYYGAEMLFADATANECTHADWELVSHTAPGMQTLNEGCVTTYVYRLPWADAYSAAGDKCGWERDTSGSNVKLVLDFAVRVYEDLDQRRNGSTITRAVEFSMPVEVQFPVQVTASPVNVQVFAPVRVLSAVIGQSVTVNEGSLLATLTLDLRTEVQKPFELHGMTESTDTLPSGVTLLSDMAGGNDDATLRQDDECDDTNADCANTWRWQYTTPSVSNDGANPCDFDGAYQVSFSIRCSEVSNTNCPIDSSTDSVEITLTVSTSNHCPTVIDSVDLTAALAVYDAPSRSTAADDFVGDGTQDDGQTADLNDWQVAYFAAPVTSTQVAISRTEFNQVWIIRHQETVTTADDDIIVLLDADDTINVAPYNTVGEIDCTVITGVSNADATPTAVSAATGCSPTNPAGGTYSFNFKHGEGGNSAAGSPSTPIFEFDIRTDSAGFAMDDDAIEEMQVNAVIDVEYANAAKRTAGSPSTNAQQSTVTSSFSMRTTSGSSSTSSSSALFGMNATVLYGAGAFLVLAILAVLVVVTRKRSSSLPSTKLQSSTELTTAV